MEPGKVRYLLINQIIDEETEASGQMEGSYAYWGQ